MAERSSRKVFGTRSADKPPVGIELLPGYTHEPLQGIDSVVGKITKEDGLAIQYEIGRVRRPGQPALGGDFSDYAQAMPEAKRLWYKEQQVGGQTVHLAHSKTGRLVVSFPDLGVNFSVTVKSPEEMAEALLMILTFPGNEEQEEE